MLFRQAILDAIRRGEVKVAFRRWRRPGVRPGTRLHTPIGLLAIDKVDAIVDADLTDAAARRAGYADLAALRRQLRPDGQLYRITLRHVGPDPRTALRQDASVDDALLARLARLDAASARGAWTLRVLRLVAANPGRRAAELAAILRVDKEQLKRDVRKLKNLGLVESLATGYLVAPRGRALLERQETL